MEQTELDSVPAATPPRAVSRARPRPTGPVSELETEIRQLYLRLMVEPVPDRLLGIVRTGLADPKG